MLLPCCRPPSVDVFPASVRPMLLTLRPPAFTLSLLCPCPLGWGCAGQATIGSLGCCSCSPSPFRAAVVSGDVTTTRLLTHAAGTESYLSPASPKPLWFPFALAKLGYSQSSGPCLLDGPPTDERVKSGVVMSRAWGTKGQGA